MVSYTYTTLDDPSATWAYGPITTPTGINDAGQIIGEYTDGSGVRQDFLWSGGAYTVLPVVNYPAVETTYVFGINDSGQVIGQYNDWSGLPHSFIEDDGTLTELNDPLSVSNAYGGTWPGQYSTFARGVNDSDQVVGYYYNESGTYGFLHSGSDYSTGYSTLEDPLASGFTEATGINNSGIIVGYYYDSVGSHGFLYANGTYTTIDYGENTVIVGINNLDEIVGYSSAGAFLYSNNTFSAITGIPATATVAGIDDAGQITGSYYDASGTHGFLAAPQQVTYPGSGLIFVNTYDTTVTAQYQSAIIAAENFFQKNISNAMTINLSFSIEAMTGVSENDPAFLDSYQSIISFSSLRSALAAHATSIGDESVTAGLESLSDPTDGAGFLITPVQAKLLGLLAPDDDQSDGSVYLNSNDTYFYDGTPSSSDSNSYDAVGALEHEISEEMGRIGGLGVNGTGDWGVLDLFRYSANSQPDDTGGRDGLPAFFSADGTTLLTQFNDPASIDPSDPTSGGDAGDWNPSMTDPAAPTPVAGGVDAFGGGSEAPGQRQIITPTDLEVMDVIGWNAAAVWSGGASGDFAAGSNWNLGVAPDASIGADITTSGTYTVSSSESESVASLAIGSGATLDITAGTFTVSGTLNNAGNIAANGGNLVVEGDAVGGAATIANSGTLEFSAASNVNVMFAAPSQSYTDISEPSADFPSFGTRPAGINDTDQIVGTFADSGNYANGFVFANGIYATLNDPFGGFNGGPATFVEGINSIGEIVGYYDDSNVVAHGFLYSSGNYTTLDDSLGTSGTVVTGINDAGEIVGYYTSQSVEHGFLDDNGTFTTLDDSLGTSGTVVTGINDAGEIVGYYTSQSVEHGFLDDNGTFTTLDDSLGTSGTVVTGINDAGEIVGYYTSQSVEHGFLDDNGTFTTLDDPLGARGTAANGVNNLGQIVGYYIDAQGNSHGFMTGAAVPDGVLSVGDPSLFTGIISGFTAGDSIDLTALSYNSDGNVNLNSANSVLQVTEDNQTFDLQLNQTPSVAGEYFILSADAAGTGTDITLNPQPGTSSAVISSGRSAFNVEVSAGGQLTVAPDATTTGDTIDSGGSEYVSSGGVDTGATVNDGGYLYVLSGATASGTVLNDPGTQVVSSGGTVVNATLNGGDQDVFGLAADSVVNSGGLQVVESGGVATGSVLNSTGTQVVSSGGSTVRTAVSGGEEDVYGIATDSIIDGSGVVIVESDGIASGTVVSGGGTLEASSGGTLSNIEVASGGSLELAAGSKILGFIEVDSGATVSGVAVSAGATLKITSGGTGLDLSVESGGTSVVFSGGITSGTSVGAGGFEMISAGGASFSATISAGGTESVFGVAVGAAIFGLEEVGSGGLALGSIIGLQNDPAQVHTMALFEQFIAAQSQPAPFGASTSMTDATGSSSTLISPPN